MIRMRDGVRLATNVYLPNASGSLGTILIRLPYDKERYPRTLRAARFFALNGYAVAVQDMRGRFASEGEFAPYAASVEDGIDTLQWITARSWSNGRVGTYGCSALGESQLILAKANDPRHAAMIVQGAGGAMGSAGGRYTYFGLFDGGIVNLASAVGWFAQHGQKKPGENRGPKQVAPATLAALPSVDLVGRLRSDPTDYEAFLAHPPGSPFWDRLGYLTDRDHIRVPTLAINTWEDQTVADTLVIAERARKEGAMADQLPRHPVVIAPGDHCDFEEAAAAGRVGDLAIDNAEQPYWNWYLDWFGYWVKGERRRKVSFAPYLFFVLGEDRWVSSDAWPPQQARPVSWYLTSERGANSAAGDGLLSQSVPSSAQDRAFDQFSYDPEDPVPSRGGPICCTGNPAERSGHVEQSDVERRSDVLVYSSAPLSDPMRIAGPLRLDLVVASSARDTDFTAKLVDVAPDGSTLSIQEGALRMRYRNDPTRPEMMKPTAVYQASIDMRAIAYYLRAGHRLRLQVSSSNFPRLERNLNTGGNNFDETDSIVATNRVMLAGNSRLNVFVLPDAVPPLANVPGANVPGNDR